VIVVYGWRGAMNGCLRWMLRAVPLMLTGDGRFGLWNSGVYSDGVHSNIFIGYDLH